MRVGYNTKPYEKHMEVYQNFSGGLNTVSPPDGMLDTELLDMLNQDISERGSLKRRHGLRKLVNGITNPQGYFRHYKTDGTYDEIYAFDGNLYKNGTSVANLLPILVGGTPNYVFQTTRPIEAVQFGGMTYIATGSKILQYDGSQCQEVDPYLPNTLEMTYLGPNILANDPESHLQDYYGLVASIDQAIPSKYSKTVNASIGIKVFCTFISGEEYEFAVQLRSASKKDDVWADPTDDMWEARDELLKQVYGTERASTAGDYEVRVSMRKTATTEILSEMVIPLTVTTLASETKEATNTIHQCNRVFLHWGRLMLYGDPANPATVYMSHLNTPNYVPSLLNLEFDSPRRESITQVVHYRNSLVIFTKSSTQALYGTGPEDYRRVMLHTDLGCVAPYGAAVMKNHIGFVSLQGIYALKTMGLTDDKATVEKLDVKISNIVPKDQNPLVVYTDGQLQVTYPNQKMRFRFYDQLGSWTKDYSEKFNFSVMYNIDGDIYCLSSLGNYVFDRSVYQDDDYNYTNYWETKYLNFGQPYHEKKLKELQVLTNPNDEELNCTIYVYADEQAVITPVEADAKIVGGVVVWETVIKRNFHVAGGSTFDTKWVLGDSVLGKNMFAVNKLRLTGKCLRTRIRVSSDEPKENHFMGFAYIFKVKKA